mgnify:CR=1 FL=1|tara:strand:- start:1253 stop:1546 length:294 start_codon:yes stop_codon:yes gene_type:complete
MTKNRSNENWYYEGWIELESRIDTLKLHICADTIPDFLKQVAKEVPNGKYLVGDNSCTEVHHIPRRKDWHPDFVVNVTWKFIPLLKILKEELEDGTS